MTTKKNKLPFWVNPHIDAMEPYVPGAQVSENGWTKLNTNENPYEPSPVVTAAIVAEFDHLRLYPNPAAAGLRQKAATHWKIDPSRVIAGNGSDDLLNLLVRTFSDAERPAGALNPSYSLYPVLAAANGSKWVDVEFEQPFHLPVKKILESGCNLFFLTCPHAPSGVSYPAREVERLADAFDGLLVVDEAYADFAGENAVGLVDRRDNVFVTRSFSKSFGLAGLRVGYGIGSPSVISRLDRVRDSYNLDRVAQSAAVAALDDWGYYEAVIGKIRYTRDDYRREFEEMGWFVYPSQSNYLFVAPQNRQGETGPEVARSLFSYLRDRKILIRYFDKHALTRDFVRISVGDEDQMMILWEEVQAWRKNV